MVPLILRTMDDPKHNWPYDKAVRYLTNNRVGYVDTWEYHMKSHISRAAKELIARQQLAFIEGLSCIQAYQGEGKSSRVAPAVW